MFHQMSTGGATIYADTQDGCHPGGEGGGGWGGAGGGNGLADWLLICLGFGHVHPA